MIRTLNPTLAYLLTVEFRDLIRILCSFSTSFVSVYPGQRETSILVKKRGELGPMKLSSNPVNSNGWETQWRASQVGHEKWTANENRSAQSELS